MFQYPPEFHAYRRAKMRCNNPKDAAYPDYGGRGILFKFNSFDDFLLCIGNRPSNKYSLDRINNDGHYEVGNVRWATAWQQQQNRRRRGAHNKTLDTVAYLIAGLEPELIARETGVTVGHVRRCGRLYKLLPKKEKPVRIMNKRPRGRPRIRPRGRPRKRRICFVPYSENFYQMLARIRAEH